MASTQPIPLLSCALAVQQYTTFAECCQVSFNRGPADPLLGDGVTNFNCYIAPGVNVLSCYYYNGAACVLTQDLNICTSSEWQGTQAHLRRAQGAAAAHLVPISFC